MASPARPLAKCILRWIYEQIHQLLEMLKQFLLMLIEYIDALIAALYAWLVQWDVLAKIEQFIWDQVQEVIEQIRNALMNVPKGPLAEFCPEFYSYFLDPARSLFEAAVASLTIFRNRYKNMISFADELQQLISYWEQIKVDLIASVEILDDAVLAKTSELGEEVP